MTKQKSWIILLVAFLALFFFLVTDQKPRTVEMAVYRFDRNMTPISAVPLQALVGSQPQTFYVSLGVTVTNPGTNNVKMENIHVVDDITKTYTQLFKTQALSDFDTITSLNQGLTSDEQMIGPISTEDMITESGFGSRTFRITLGTEYQPKDPAASRQSTEYYGSATFSINKDTCTDGSEERSCSPYNLGKYCIASVAGDSNSPRLIDCANPTGCTDPNKGTTAGCNCASGYVDDGNGVCISDSPCTDADGDGYYAGAPNYVIYRTTTLDYPGATSSDQIAITTTCGQGLIPYSRETAGMYYSTGRCATDSRFGSLIYFSVPGNKKTGTITTEGDGVWKLYSDVSDSNNAWLCQDDLDRSSASPAGRYVIGYEKISHTGDTLIISASEVPISHTYERWCIGNECGALKDCNDRYNKVNSGKTEICNRIDDNCDDVYDKDCVNYDGYPTICTLSYKLGDCTSYLCKACYSSMFQCYMPDTQTCTTTMQDGDVGCTGTRACTRTLSNSKYYGVYGPLSSDGTACAAGQGDCVTTPCTCWNGKCMPDP